MTDVRREPRSPGSDRSGWWRSPPCSRSSRRRAEAAGAIPSLRRTATTPGSGSTAGSTSLIDSSQCDPSTLTQGISGNTIKLGTSLPLSGTYSAFNAILKGEQAYFSYINAQGGVTVAGKKYQIDLVSKDDAYDPAQTSTNVDTLINSDKVFALFNTVGTKNNLGIRETVNSDCVPDLAIASGAVQWGNTKYPWMLGSELVPYPLEMQVFVDYLKKNKPNAKIALLVRERRLRPVVQGHAGATREGHDAQHRAGAELQLRGLRREGAGDGPCRIEGGHLRARRDIARVPERTHGRARCGLETADLHVGDVRLEAAVHTRR